MSPIYYILTGETPPVSKPKTPRQQLTKMSKWLNKKGIDMALDKGRVIQPEPTQVSSFKERAEKIKQQYNYVFFDFEKVNNLNFVKKCQ